MDVANLARLDAERVAVRGGLLADGAVEPGEPNKKADDAHDLVDDVSAVGDDDALGHTRSRARVTAVGHVHEAGGGIAAFEPGAGVAKRHRDVDLVEAVKVGIARSLDDGARVPLGLGDRVPRLERVPVGVARRVEEPVALVRHDGLDGRNLLSLGVVHYTRTDDVGVASVVLRDQLCPRCALLRVVDAAVRVHGDGLREGALVHAHAQVVL